MRLHSLYEGTWWKAPLPSQALCGEHGAPVSFG
jgi:hypothetical protein